VPVLQKEEKRKSNVAILIKDHQIVVHEIPCRLSYKNNRRETDICRMN
jgi:hypothetical protein